MHSRADRRFKRNGRCEKHLPFLHLVVGKSGLAGAAEDVDQLVADQLLDVCTGALGNLQDDRSVLLAAGLCDGLNDSHVVDIESADGIAAVVSLLEHFGSSYQSHWNQSFLLTGKCLYISLPL